MRHSTPVLTANVYIRLEMDDAREAVGRIDVGASDDGHTTATPEERQAAVGS